MYIRLYFPKLSRIHQMLFAAQREMNNLLFAFHTEKPPNLEELATTGGKVAHFLRLMEAEIVNNRDALIGDRMLPRRFKESTADEIDAVIPRPAGPPFNRSTA
jgi:hypothetical protein